MQEWIIAMLVISVLLILRDMAKTILTGRMSKKEEAFSLCEEHPQKEKVERYAASFQKLTHTCAFVSIRIFSICPLLKNSFL